MTRRSVITALIIMMIGIVIYATGSLIQDMGPATGHSAFGWAGLAVSLLGVWIICTSAMVWLEEL